MLISSERTVKGPCCLAAMPRMSLCRVSASRSGSPMRSRSHASTRSVPGSSKPLIGRHSVRSSKLKYTSGLSPVVGRSLHAPRPGSLVADHLPGALGRLWRLLGVDAGAPPRRPRPDGGERRVPSTARSVPLNASPVSKSDDQRGDRDEPVERQCRRVEQDVVGAGGANRPPGAAKYGGQPMLPTVRPGRH